MRKYYILWEFGEHKRWIKTTKKDYNETIISMSSEFKIYQEDEKMKIIKHNNKEEIIEWHNDYVYNYYGDKYIFASYEK